MEFDGLQVTPYVTDKGRMAYSLRATGIKAARLGRRLRTRPDARPARHPVTVPVDGRCAVALESYRDRAPLLTIRAARPALLVTLTVPERIEAGHVQFARQLAASAAAYAVEVERVRGALPVTARKERRGVMIPRPRPMFRAPAGALDGPQRARIRNDPHACTDPAPPGHARCDRRRARPRPRQ